MVVIWSDEAISDYHQNIDYLLGRWSEKVAIEFIEDVEAIIELIKDNPELYPLCGHKLIRRAVIRKQVTIFYEVNEGTIRLVRFWNNFQDPENLSL